MKPLLLAVGVSLSFLGISCPAHAQEARSISANVAKAQTIPIELYPGHGTTLNFRSTGETIQKTWLDDPSQVTLDFDDSSCLANERSKCAARVIHLRRIHRLNFPNLPATATTSLTVLTDRNVYNFRLTFPTSGTPKYSILTIQPNRSTLIAANRIRGQSGAHLIEQGLQVAESRQLISRGDVLWNRVRSLLNLIRNGVQVAEASKRVGVSPQLVARLVEMGMKTQSL
jgi:hypothetical protein